MNSKIYYKIKKVFNSQKTVDEFFREQFSDLDYKHTAALSALVLVEDKINSNKLKTYSDIIVKFNLDDFAFAVVCLYEMYEDNGIPFSIQRKKEVMLSILQALVDNDNADFDEYRRRTEHVLSGAYKLDRYWKLETPLYGRNRQL
ncbi:hypothetical protein EA184_14965 [Escherichia coli]|uniref:hypothetical protein n=1 Tax=Escherichia coli TaxID=562 RepID=UPI00122E917C|nr:hypothetical protein [Escherichia coli]KAA1863104.1 hypothetical protein EA184_14965 [Escherichia coli]HAK9392139.1 hypothetical protein [Escherichia coli]